MSQPSWIAYQNGTFPYEHQQRLAFLFSQRYAKQLPLRRFIRLALLHKLNVRYANLSED